MFMFYDLYSGYMVPEYAIDGQYSVKSVVFNLGILMLEIVSGKKNRGVLTHENLNLIGQVSINTMISSLRKLNLVVKDFSIFFRHGNFGKKKGL